jgi:hypothetical protein
LVILVNLDIQKSDLIFVSLDGFGYFRAVNNRPI